MITILRRRVASNIWVTTLKVKVTVWPCRKIVIGPLLRDLKWDFTTISQKWSPYWDNVSLATFGLFLHFELCLLHNTYTTRGIPSCVQNLFGEHHPVLPALAFFLLSTSIESFWSIILSKREGKNQSSERQYTFSEGNTFLLNGNYTSIDIFWYCIDSYETVKI
jgi:hypothetical protein